MIYGNSMTIEKARKQIAELEARLPEVPSATAVVENGIRTEINTLKSWIKSQEKQETRNQAVRESTGIYCGSPDKYLADLINERGMVKFQMDNRDIPAHKEFYQKELDLLDAQIVKFQQAIANAE